MPVRDCLHKFVLPFAALAALWACAAVAHETKETKAEGQVSRRLQARNAALAEAADETEPTHRRVSHLDPNVDVAETLDQRLEAPPQGFLPWGPLREVRFDMTYVDAEELYFADLEAWAILAVPTISEESPLVFTPGYGLHFVDARTPPVPDLPGHLHDLYLDVMWRHRWLSMPELTTDIALTPGLYSDFAGAGDDDALRVGARVVGDYMLQPDMFLRIGLAYLDRDDVNFLPIGGVIWKPDPDTTWELVLPKPRYTKRFFCDGCLERFWYVGGEFGGGAWSVERANGAGDVLSYSDWRAVLGYRQKTKGGPMALVEIGWVFNRHLEYRSGQEFDPAGCFVARIGFGY